VVPLLLGAVGFVVTAIGSVIWQRVFVREMGA
jgi:sorbitol-specific phosphotransferase system component IIA